MDDKTQKEVKLSSGESRLDYLRRRGRELRKRKPAKHDELDILEAVVGDDEEIAPELEQAERMAMDDCEEV